MVSTVTSQPEGKKFESTGQLGSFCVEFVLPVPAWHSVLGLPYHSWGRLLPPHYTEGLNRFYIFISNVYSVQLVNQKHVLLDLNHLLKCCSLLISMYVSGFFFHSQPQFCHTGPAKTLLIIFLANNYFKVLRN